MLPTASLEKYEKIMSELKKCPKSVKDRLNRNEVCKKKEACYDLVRVPLRQKKYMMGFKRVACKCSNKISIQCGQDHCALNQEVCSNLLRASKKFISNLNSC